MIYNLPSVHLEYIVDILIKLGVKQNTNNQFLKFLGYFFKKKKKIYLKNYKVHQNLSFII